RRGGRAGGVPRYRVPRAQREACDERSPRSTAMSRSRLFAGLIISLALRASACGDETVATPTTSKPPPPRAAAPAAQTAPPVDLSQLPAREFRESDFVETDASRDPFRSFEQLFADKGKLDQPMQRHVLIDQYSLDELRLVGVISR